mmetsp:Transcript_14501/g.36953  ORF Transcript_14501/g.36953 Transcript_14501/m.36953 type:complete len:85 (-) Transcript_14501:803-1057(-)
MSIYWLFSIRKEMKKKAVLGELAKAMVLNAKARWLRRGRREEQNRPAEAKKGKRAHNGKESKDIRERLPVVSRSSPYASTLPPP